MKALLPYIFALGTAMCWGLYGPTLGKARALGDGTPFKPYVGIGVAYLLIAIIGGLIAMAIVSKDTWNFTDTTSRWGFAAGVLGALGAFSLTLSMFSGGAKIPHAVMPWVFGGAVTVTALYSVFVLGARGNIWMWVGIVGMGLGAVLVAANTPHGPPKKPDGKEDAHAAVSSEIPASNPSEAFGAAGDSTEVAMTPDESMRRIDDLVSHIWMVRTFIKHSEEVEDDDELAEVHRELYDFAHALGPPLKSGDSAGYLKTAKKKLSKLKKATELFSEIQPEISDHTNFQMAERSLRLAVGELTSALGEAKS